MKRLLRILGVVVFLILIALISLPILFKGKIQEGIQKAANENLNATLAFDDVSLSLIRNFPNASVSIEQLSIEGIDVFEGVKLVSANEINATVDIMSLFGDEINIKSVSLVQPEIRVKVLADGTANYDIAKESEETETTSSEESGAFALNLENYRIEQGYLLYDDATLPMRMEIQGLDHEGSGDFTQDLFTLATNTNAASFDVVYDGIRYVKNASIDLKADLEIDNQKAKYTFKDNLLRFNQLELKADGFVEMPEDEIDMDIRFQTVDTEILHLLSMVPAEFAADLAGVEASGSMDLTGYVRGTYSDESMPGFYAALKVNDGRFAYPDMPKSVESIAIDMEVDASAGIDHDDLTINVDQFYMEIANNPIDLELHLKNPYTDPDIDASVKAKVVFASLSEVIPLDEGDQLEGSINADVMLKGRMSALEEERYNDFEAGGQVVLLDLLYRSDSIPYDMNIRSCYMDFSPRFISLSNLSANIGATDLAADGRIVNYLDYALRDSLLTGNFNLRSKKMDLNEFMATETEIEDENEQEQETTGYLVLPKNVDFTLSASFEKMLYDNLEIDNTKGTVVLRDGVASLDGLELALLGGKVTMDGSYNSAVSPPLMDMDFGVRNMDIQSAAESFYTIDKLAPIAKSCRGKFSTQMKLDCALDENMEPTEPTINGGGKVQTKGVYVEKFLPLTKVADELGIEALSNPYIEDANITYSFKDGRVFVDPFTIKLDGIPTTIEGSMSFSQELDYRMKMDVPVEKLPGNLGNQASGLLNDINNKLGSNLSVGTKIPVSIRITGTMEKPSVAGNYGEVLKEQKQEITEQVKEAVKEEVKEQIDNAKEEAIEKARQEAAELINQAQKESASLMENATKEADRLKNEAYKEAQKIEDSAKNPLERAAKKLAADKIRKEADEAHQRALKKAQQQADKIVAEAEKKAEEKIQEAESL